MKFKFNVILSLVTTLNVILSSCANNSEQYKTPDQLAKELQNSIMICFVNKDKDTLKSYFSQYEIDTCTELDSQIDEAFKFIKGKIISYDDNPKSSACGSSERKSYGATTYNIITDKNTIYKIDFYGWLTNNQEIDKVGVINIRIVNMTEHDKLTSKSSKEEQENIIKWIGTKD